MLNIKSISVETRARKSEPYTEDGALERWINEIAEATGHTVEEVCKTALVRLEKERIEKERRIAV